MLASVISSVFSQLKSRQVLPQSEVEALCAENFEKMKSILDEMCLVAGEKFYLRQLDTPELTSARNMLLQILHDGEDLTRGQAVERVIDDLVKKGIKVSKQDVGASIKKICHSTGGNAKQFLKLK